MDTIEDPEEYLEHVVSTDEYPSDVDVKEAKDLAENVKEKHRRRRRELTDKFNQSKEIESSQSKSKEERRKLRKSLKPKLSTEESVDKTESRRRSKLKEEEKDVKDFENVKDLENVKDQKMVVNNQETGGKAKKTSRLEMAARLREKRKREKEIEEGTQDSEMIGTGGDLRSSMEAPLSTRFDPDQISSTKWREQQKEAEITWETLKQQESITDKQAFDFFCKEWSDSGPRSVKKQEEGPITEGVGTGTETRPSIDVTEESKLLEDRGKDDMMDYPKVKSSKTFLETRAPLWMPAPDEVDVLYIPGNVDTSFLENQTLRNPEEEGLYVGKRPYISISNERLLESRIQTEKKMDWYGEDGRLKILPDPLKEIPDRPLLWNEHFNPKPYYLKTEDMKPILTKYGMENNDSTEMGAQFEMVINIDSIVFSHHHLFSVEHVYSQRLKQLFAVYHYAVQQEGFYFFEQRITSLKHAIEHLKKVSNVDAVEECRKRICNYRQEIRNTRIARNNEEAHLRTLVGSIIKTWKKIKEIRSNSGLTLTNIVVKIRKEPTNAEEDKQVYEKEIVERLEEEREHYDDEYQALLVQYNKEKSNYDRQQAKKTAARERQANELKKEGVNADQLDEKILIQKKEDSDLLAEPDLPFPIAPENFNETTTRERIVEEMRKCRRLPGEPKITPLLRTGSISDSNFTPQENLRRNLMQQYQYYGELYFNSKKVVTTSTCQLNLDFAVRFNQTIPIIISQYPQLITLKVYEKNGISGKLLHVAELDVPLPKQMTHNVDMQIYNFSTGQRVSHKSDVAVGSGVQTFALENLDGSPIGESMSPLYTSGTIFAKLAWAVDDDGILKIPSSYLNSEKFKNQRHVRDPLLALGLTKILDDQRKQNWKDIESHLDPNNPQDAKVYTALHTNEALGMDVNAKFAADYFRLNPYMDEFDFINQEEMDRSLRFRMITLRSKNVPSFVGLPIPALEERVPVELITEYDNRKLAGKQKVKLSSFEARKMKHEEFIERIREEVLIKLKSALLKRSLAEVVKEEEIPTISDIFPKLLRLNRFNRPLQKVPEATKPIPIQSIYEMRVDIIVVIKRATNLPIDDERKSVNPFVEINFQNHQKFTHVLEGPNPAWDIEIRVPFKPPSTQNSLERVKDSLLISVHDQQVIDLNKRDIDQKTSVHHRYERHCLGTLEIPFNTVYINSKVEGNFRLKKPAFLLGYNYDETELGEDSMLSVFITLDPEIHPPQSLKERFDSVEHPVDLEVAEKFYDTLQLKFPNRCRRPTVVNMQCQETLITRFVTPLQPPPKYQEGLDIQNDPKAMAIYVSLIPFMADALVFPGISDIWSTCDQFLEMQIGDEEEHAVLLCNFFLHHYKDDSSVNVYLCMGNAIPEGPTAYVVTINNGRNITLWNASTGEWYDQHDATCPLMSIGLLVNQNNVWANIQVNSRPNEIRFDVTNKAFWEPLWKGGDMEKRQRPSIQPSTILYKEPFIQEIEDLQLRLDNDIRSSIIDWRMGLKTNFLLHKRKDIIRILENLEKNNHQISDEDSNSIRSLHKQYRAFGFPINLPYMDVPLILERVRATGIHLTAAPTVEFCVATYIKAYHNSVLSIWIYLAALIRD